MNKTDLYTYIDSQKSLLTALSDQVWEFAETAFQEYRSAQLHCSTLEQAGFTVERGVAGIETAYRATYGSGKPVIGLLAEYDALAGLNQKACCPERQPTSPADAGKPGHGCGHNLLGVGALGGALAIKKHLEETERPGTVVVFGCPGEEGGSGKAFMARDGVFDGLDAALTWHTGSFNSLVSGSSLANVQVLYKFYGVSAHASSAPENGRSALDAVELMNMGTQFLREHMEDADRVHYAITNSGGFSPNVVQARADVLYLIRSPKSANVRSLYERVNKIAQGAAMMTGTRVEIDFIKGCSERVRNDTMAKLIYQNMEQAPLPKYTEAEFELARQIRASYENPKDVIADVTRRCGPSFRPQLVELYKDDPSLTEFLLPYYENDVVSKGSTDVGDVTWVCPTGSFTAVSTAVGTPGHSWQYVACNKSTIAHKGLLFACKVLAGSVLDLLENPELIERAKQEHRERTGGAYVCPIPKGVKPRAISDL